MQRLGPKPRENAKQMGKNTRHALPFPRKAVTQRMWDAMKKPHDAHFQGRILHTCENNELHDNLQQNVPLFSEVHLRQCNFTLTFPQNLSLIPHNQPRR